MDHWDRCRYLTLPRPVAVCEGQVDQLVDGERETERYLEAAAEVV